MTGNQDEHFKIRLLGFTEIESKLPLARLVNEICECGIQEAKRLVESPPNTITTYSTIEEAKEIADRIENVGGITEVIFPISLPSDGIDDDSVVEMNSEFSGEVDDVINRFDSVLTEFWEQTTAPDEIGIPNLPTVHKFNRKSAFRQKRQSQKPQEDRLNPLYEHLLAKKELEDKLGKSLRPVPPELELPTNIPKLRPLPKTPRETFKPTTDQSNPSHGVTDLSDDMLQLAPETRDTVFWVRRGQGPVRGPFKEINLRNNIANQRVLPSDSFSTKSADGPWQKISSRFQVPGQR
tara:strand:+ start:894 stop:1775 length:882 start_codon:yes stop_codon:yes gene_type:complete